MHVFTQKLLNILDGSPRPKAGLQRGQSLVELVLITPLMLIMVAGVIEIGWYANHVLIMLEVTRVGARQATLYTGPQSHNAWPSAGSLAPISYRLTSGFVTPNNAFNDFTGMINAVDDDALRTGDLEAASNYRDCTPGILNNSNPGFYNSVACSMINSMEPLGIKGRAPGRDDMLGRRIRLEYNTPNLVGREWQNGRLWYTYKYDEMFIFPDDIVVSVVSLQAINNLKNAGSGGPSDPRNVFIPDTGRRDEAMYSRTWDFGARFPRGYQVVVAGRYPTNANECNVLYQPTTSPDPDRGSVVNQNRLYQGESYLRRIMTLGAVSNDYEARQVWEDPTALAAMRAPLVVAGTFNAVRVNVADSATWPFRDPFDFYAFDNRRTADPADPNRFLELAGYDDDAEFQRGYVWTGQNLVDDQLDPLTGLQLFCLGSEWSDVEIQNLMNTPNFLQRNVNMPPGGDPDNWPAGWQTSPTYADYRQWQERAYFLPSQGMVLVEMFWRHDILLDFPLMTPIIRLMEASGGPYNIVISAWAVFPLPSAEPNLTFALPPKRNIVR